MKRVFSGEALEAVLAAAERPPSNEDSRADRSSSLGDLRRSFVTRGTTDRRAPGTRAFLAATLVLFTFLTVVMTYPQALHMTDGVHDDGDPLMLTWVLAWVAHQLPRAPAHLFDANMFYPERNTLAFSETLLVPGVIVAPLHWLGVGPILIYNLVFLSGFAISGVGVALLVRRLTGNAGAAILAGIVFACPPYRIDPVAHRRRRARARGGGRWQRHVAQLSGAARGERALRQSVRAVHAARAPAVSRVRRNRAGNRRPVAAAVGDTACVRARPDPRS